MTKNTVIPDGSLVMGSPARIKRNLTWEENLKWLKEGTINFLIGQDAAVQGHSPVTILFQLLFDSKAPEKEYQYTDIVIRTKYNMG